MRTNITLKTALLASAVVFMNFVTPSSKAMDKDAPSIIQVLKTSEDKEKFSRLVDLLEVTGLDKILAEGGPYTLIAPTDGAFDKYDAKHPNVINDLIKADQGVEGLKKLLLNHVIKGDVSEENVAKMDEAKTAATSEDNQTLVIGSNDDYYTVNGLNLVATDIQANNGTIHVIQDGILSSGAK
jgi:uncharacterized surface protein with fasciclin (FAS1) repeats